MTRKPVIRRESAMTLVELMVVIGIIAILAALLLAVVGRVKDQGAQTTCVNNLHQLIVATHLHCQDNSDKLPWSNWIHGDQDGRPGWLYELDPSQTGTNRFRQQHGLLWPHLAKKRRMYQCPFDTPKHPLFRYRAQQLSSYVMNGAVNNYRKVDVDAYLLGEFNAEDILFWETDERDPFFFNDGASRPDEGVSPRHGNGAVIGSFGDTVEFIRLEHWYLEVAQTNRNRLWCAPAVKNGRGNLPPYVL